MADVKRITTTTSSGARRVAVYSDNYSNTLDKLDELFEILQKDFPRLARKDVIFVIYNGEFLRGIPGLETSLPAEVEIPDSYVRVKRFEPTFG